MKVTTFHKKKSTRPPIEQTADVQALLRRVVKQLDTKPPPASEASAEAEAVILDVEVDGIRCRLVRAARQPKGALVILSPRELEICRMVAKGYPNKTIAGVLEISAWTVGTYLRRVFAKLGVGSRAAMVARLMDMGLLRA
jgi:DNA-binding CsgD family transcriptional regulator